MATCSAGVSRAVLCFSRWAIKVPRADSWRGLLWGLLANLQEGDLGRRGWPELCPVLFAIPGGLAVVARRAEMCTPETCPSEAALLELIARANAAGRCVPAEPKPSSWGWLNGRLVAVDYG